MLDKSLGTDKLYKTFSSTLKQIMDKVVPERRQNNIAKNRLVEPWMTAGLKQASSTKLTLYKNMLKPHSTDNDLNR